LRNRDETLTESPLKLFNLAYGDDTNVAIFEESLKKNLILGVFTFFHYVDIYKEIERANTWVQ